MSGPKAFRIVTREELIARSEMLLRQLDTAISNWKQICERNGAVDDEAATAVIARRQSLQRMLDGSRFTELQKQVTAEISFLRSDAESRVERAIAAATRAMESRRRNARTAQMLLDALLQSGRAISEELRLELQSSHVSEKAIERAFALLAPAEEAATATKRQRELASRLGQGEQRITLGAWLSKQPGLKASEADLRIDRYLAELSALGIDPSPFGARQTAIASQPSSRQVLLTNSLLLDLGQAVRDGRKRSTQLAQLKERAVELAAWHSAGVDGLRSRIEQAIDEGNTSSAPALIAEADALVEEELRAQAADARRRAVLQALASLGYEVTEGMATAWVQSGHVLLRKAANPDYGVELAGGTKSDWLQVRAVAFGNVPQQRDASRDRDVEVAWCSEFEGLRSLVARTGGGIEIDHALPFGAVPIKIITDPKREEQAGEAQKLKTMTR